MEISMEKFVAFLKNQGFVYQGSEIYGGLANAWDYGPLGVELLNNIKNTWWKKFVQESPYNVGMDSAILMNPKVWVASGHVGGFSDPLTDCKSCGTRYRADKLIEDYTNGEITGDGMSNDEIMNFISEHHITCPKCGGKDFTPIRKFNLMFKTNQGVIEDEKNVVYLRPETAQGILTLKMFKEQLEKRYHLELVKLEKVSVTKLLQVTLSSVHVNSNKWN